jgi:hypothetical protein
MKTVKPCYESQPFFHFLSPCTSTRIQTQNLRMRSHAYFHCATPSGPVRPYISKKLTLITILMRKEREKHVKMEKDSEK